LRRYLKKLSNFLFHSWTRITFRNPVDVEVIYFNKSGEVVEPKHAKPFVFKGLELDVVDKPRVVQKIGGSHYVPVPRGWLPSITNDGKTDACLVRREDGEYAVVFSKPIKSEVIA